VRDRQAFNKFVLRNGITVHFYPNDEPITYAHLIIRRGSVNNTETYPFGTFHLLEHAVLAEESLVHEVKLVAGSMRGVTFSRETLYSLDAPTEHFAGFWPLFLEQVFGSTLQEEVIEEERRIIESERKRFVWYPGGDEVRHYLNTSWMEDMDITLDQGLGTAASLEQLTLETLVSAYAQYRSAQIDIIVVGSVDIQDIVRAAQEIPTLPKVELPELYRPLRWKNQAFHTKELSDIGQPTLYIGMLSDPLPDLQTMRALYFIGYYMISSALGELYDWLRRQKQWSYSLGFEKSRNDSRLRCTYKFELPGLAEVDQVRTEFLDRCLAAVSKPDKVAREVKRQIGTYLYINQTGEEIADSAWGDLMSHGETITETQWRELTERCTDINLLQEVAQRYLSPEVRGEVCLLPADE
jgi:predicted Zn-dependent peptidase